MITLGHLLHLFKRLNHPNRRPRRWTLGEIEQYRREQDECYVLAQALTSLTSPRIQQELDATRREVMELLDRVRQLQQGVAFGDVVTPVRRISYNERWSDHQVSPEFSRDPYVSGFIVPRVLSTRLIKLHKQQIAAITDLLRGAR